MCLIGDVFTADELKTLSKTQRNILEKYGKLVVLTNPAIRNIIKPLREVVWVILGHFRKAVFSCCCRCGHVGNALALSIMSTAMSAAPPARSAE
jgi:hypothetical protein